MKRILIDGRFVLLRTRLRGTSLNEYLNYI